MFHIKLCKYLEFIDESENLIRNIRHVVQVQHNEVMSVTSGITESGTIV